MIFRIIVLCWWHGGRIACRVMDEGGGMAGLQTG